MQLAGSSALLAAVGYSIDDHGAGAADPLAAIGIKCNRLVAVRDNALVYDVEHLKKGHIRTDIDCLMSFESAGVFSVVLSPDSKC